MIEDANNTAIDYGIRIVDIYNILKDKHGFTPEQASRFLKKKSRVSVTNGNWTVEKLLDGFDNDDDNNNTNTNNSTITTNNNKRGVN
jgi:hypothetical protein